jgi:hypothetical protein
MSILERFSKVYVINLPSRTDRRRDTEAMFRRIGLEGWQDRVEFFPAVRPDSRGGFATLGARGCFMSHLGALKRMAASGAGDLLLMEDDLEIDRRFVADSAAIIRELDREPWDFAYFGHVLDDQPEARGPLAPYDGRIVTAHFVAMSARVVPRLIDFLEGLLRREEGDPAGGPMDVDGAYSMFREWNPDVRTLVARPNLGWQRASSSDIRPGWVDRIPFARHLTNRLRAVKHRLKP